MEMKSTLKIRKSTLKININVLKHESQISLVCENNIKLYETHDVVVKRLKYLCEMERHEHISIKNQL